MSKTVVALYRDWDKARQAYSALSDAGIDRDRISLIRRDEDASGSTTGVSSSSSDSNIDQVEDKLDAGSGAVIGGATGAVIGGTAGAFLAGVAGLAIPGLGPLLGIGPLAATILGGAGIGAVSGGIAGALVNSGVSEEHAELYQRGVELGGTLVTVHAEEDQAERAAEILSQYDPVDIDRREDFSDQSWSGASSRQAVDSTGGVGQSGGLGAGGVREGILSSGLESDAIDRPGRRDLLKDRDPAEYLRQVSESRRDLTSAGTAGVATPATESREDDADLSLNDDEDLAGVDRNRGRTDRTLTGTTATGGIAATGSLNAGLGDELPAGQQSIPIVQEQLEVHKREVSGGTARVRTRVYERPVEASVTLREEKLNVERRSADRPLRPGEDAFRERTIEVTETREEPVIHKEARVVEEVLVDKTSTERTETVRDTVRSTDVEVERDADRGLGRSTSARPGESAGSGGSNPGSGISGNQTERSRDVLGSEGNTR